MLDIVRDALHDALARSLAADVDAPVVSEADEPMSAAVQLPVEVVEHHVAEQRRQRRTLRGPLLARVHQPAIHDARFQVAPDQPQHPFVVNPPGDPGHQSIVLDAIKERVHIKIDTPRRVI